MEEIKVVMEAIQGLGSDAKIAFIWWLVINFVLRYLFVSGTVITVFVIIFKLVSPLIRNHFFISQIKSIFGYYEDYITDIHKAEVLKILNDHRKDIG